MPKVTAAHLEARRHQIMDAAAACFCQNGFHHSTMHDICHQAELSPGAVYRYFRSKEEIIESMLRERQRSSAAIIEAARGHGSTIEVFDELANVFFSHLGDAQSCALSVELQAEALRSPRIRDALLCELRNVTEPFADLVRSAQTAGEINPSLDPQAIAQVMVSFFEGLILQKATDHSIDVWRYVAVMKAMMQGKFWNRDTLEGGR